MTKTTRKIGAGVLLVLLIAVPFIDWKLGAVLWICAWLVHIFQNLLSHKSWPPDQDMEDYDEKPEE